MHIDMNKTVNPVSRIRGMTMELLQRFLFMLV